MTLTSSIVGTSLLDTPESKPKGTIWNFLIVQKWNKLDR